MKKLFVCAAAAIVALASCSKTELINTEAPKEIGFKAVTGSITKAAIMNTNDFSNTLGVLAYTSSDVSPYFDNAEFSKKTESKDDGNGGKINVITWNGSKYWPILSYLDFVVYSPYQASGVSVVNNASDKNLSVTIANNNLTPNSQIDYMYGSTYISNKNQHSGNIGVELNHALSLISVKFTKDTPVTITSAQIDDTYQTGKYTVTYIPDANKGIEWTDKGSTKYDLDLANSDSSFDNTYMVVPSAATSITFTYRMSGMSQSAPNLTHTIDLKETWEAGYHYTYLVNISANEIKFVPTIKNWETGSLTSDVEVE